MQHYQNFIEEIWHKVNINHDISSSEKEEYIHKIDEIIELLDKGELFVCYKNDQNNWSINIWIKKAILLYLKLQKNKLFQYQLSTWYDKIEQKCQSFSSQDFDSKKIRALPGCYIRKGAYIGENTVIMPSFVNIGAHVGNNTMIDTWSTVGSCAYIGNNCHISGGVGIGGVLEPLQSHPVIIEDNVFIGARSEIAEGVIVEKGAVISMGVYISSSTKIVDRSTGEIIYGRVPSYSVVVPGTLPGKSATDPHLYCAVIVKKVDERTRKKTALTSLLRYDEIK